MGINYIFKKFSRIMVNVYNWFGDTVSLVAHNVYVSDLPLPFLNFQNFFCAKIQHAISMNLRDIFRNSHASASKVITDTM